MENFYYFVTTLEKTNMQKLLKIGRLFLFKFAHEE